MSKHASTAPPFHAISRGSMSWAKENASHFRKGSRAQDTILCRRVGALLSQQQTNQVLHLCQTTENWLVYLSCGVLPNSYKALGSVPAAPPVQNTELTDIPISAAADENFSVFATEDAALHKQALQAATPGTSRGRKKPSLQRKHHNTARGPNPDRTDF